MINGRTKVCALIGDPVEHSLSPPIQNAAFSALSLNYVFVTFRVRREGLADAVAGLRALGVAGFTITIPHKVAVMSYLDRIDPIARAMGAVNLVVNADGVLVGYNSDAPGFLEPLTRRGINPAGKNVVILGAGGAARAASYTLASAGADIILLNRTIAHAEELSARLKTTLKKEIIVLELNTQNLKRALSQSDIIVNTTSVGMIPNIDESPVPADLLRPELVVYDVIYTPAETKLLRDARLKGAVTLNGAEMLVAQGAIAFEKWVGFKAPAYVMTQALQKALGQDEK